MTSARNANPNAQKLRQSASCGSRRKSQNRTSKWLAQEDQHEHEQPPQHLAQSQREEPPARFSSIGGGHDRWARVSLSRAYRRTRTGRNSWISSSNTVGSKILGPEAKTSSSSYAFDHHHASLSCHLYCGDSSVLSISRCRHAPNGPLRQLGIKTGSRTSPPSCLTNVNRRGLPSIRAPFPSKLRPSGAISASKVPR